MEGTFQPGFYCPERYQENRQHQQPPQHQQHQKPPQHQQHQKPPQHQQHQKPSQQQQHQQPSQHQQHQQHVAPYHMDLPYHTTSQHQPDPTPLDQSFRAFPAPHPIPHPIPPMSSSVYHDSGPGLSNANIIHQAHPQPPVTLRGHAVKSSSLSANYAPPINTTHGAVKEERYNLHIATHESVVASNILPPALHKSVVERNIQPTTSYESGIHVESNALPITSHTSSVKNATPQQGQSSIKSAPSLQSTDHREQCLPLSQPSHQANASPPAPDVSAAEPPLFAALNLTKTISVMDLPLSLSLRVASLDKVEGVVAKDTVEKGVEFGPYTGTLLDEEQGSSKGTTWEICVSGRVYHYIDGRKTWMSHVRCAHREDEQNLEAYQYYGEVYFRSTKVIEPGSELKVFYSEDYMKHVGGKTGLNELGFNQDAQKFQCSLCEDLFSSPKLLLRHIRLEHTDSKPHDKLPLVTPKKREKKHDRLKISSKHLFKTKTKAREQEESDLKCATCGKVFFSSGRLKAHEIFHDYNQDHTCPVCGKRQKNAQTWAKHMNLHKPANEARPHKCNECNGRYKSKAALRKHQHQIHGYPCRLCSERFSRMKDCKTHEQTHQAFIPPHAAEEYLVAELSPDEPKDMLGKRANYYQRRFQCRYCPKRYSDYTTVRTHEKENHTGEGTFKCSHCPKVYTSESRLKTHLLFHEQTRIYRCTLCPSSFASESALNSHQGEHTGLKPVKCDVCGKGFRTRKHSLAHRRRVHQERPKRFFCSYCNFGFAEKGDFNKHEQRHKGIRRYICKECGKPFTSNTSLTAHIRALHTKERPFSCEICGKTFALNFKYTLHMVRHNVQVNGSSLQQQ